MKHCIFMPTTIRVSENCQLYKRKQLASNISRLKQYTEGILKVLELNKSIEIDIIISDNSDFFDEDSDLKNILIDKNVKIIKNAPNVYGGKNKGSGVIENWLYSKELLMEYHYIIHFEPRQLLVDNHFINSYIENPRNLFNVNTSGNHFNTGIFCIQSQLLFDFIKEYSPERLMKNKLSLEYILYKFMNKYEYDTILLMGLKWYDTFKNKTIEW